MKKTSTRILLTVLIFILSGCALIDRGTGTLTGHVTIGPLTPVVGPGIQQPAPSPEVYAAWQIVVYTTDMRREVARTDIDPDGSYQIVLPVGGYTVTAAPTSGILGPGGSSQYPVGIIRDAITRLDIDIDTGIR